MSAFILAALLASGTGQVPATGASRPAAEQAVPLRAPDPNAPPVVDMALRVVRAFVGGSSIARSAVRGDETAALYAGLERCRIGAAAEDPAHESSLVWRASGRVQSVERGIAVADVEWQRIEYRPTGVVAGPRVRTTLTLPLGERVAVDFADVAGSACRMDGLVFEIGVAPDHGWRLSMSGEGRSAPNSAGAGGGGGGVGRRVTTDEADAQRARLRQAADAARAAPVVIRPMPPREYAVDAWLVPEAPGAPSPSAPGLAQRLSQVVGGTGGRFAFPPMRSEAVERGPATVDISALVIPVGGDRLMIAITRHVTPGDGGAPESAGWIKVVPLPTVHDVLSFEIPAPGAREPAFVPRQGYGLRLRVGPRSPD